MRQGFLLGATTVAIVFVAAGVAAFGMWRAWPGATMVGGKGLYMTHCASCHGTKLEGQPDWRQRKPDGRLPAPPHDASGHTWHHTTKHLIKMTRLGTEAVVGGGYVSDMPGFKDVLDDNQIGAVLSYIKSTWPEHIRKRHDAMNRRAAQ